MLYSPSTLCYNQVVRHLLNAGGEVKRSGPGPLGWA
jgi:hypothetical protein